MALIHHPVLRANGDVPDTTLEIWEQRGWLEGPHPDTDPDDPRAVPAVLPSGEPAPADPPADPTDPPTNPPAATADKTQKDG